MVVEDDGPVRDVLLEELLPPNTVHITIEKDLERGFDYRLIRIEDRHVHE